MTKLSLKPKRWRVGAKRAKISRKGAPVGTRIRFSLTRGARVKLKFFALKPGHRAGHRCVAPGKGKPGGQTCMRKVLVGVLKFNGHAGRNVVRFQGRLGRKKKLRPGRYKVTVSATDPTAPGRSTSRSATFTVVRG